MILLTGATGNVGRAVAAVLAGHGEHFRAMVRDDRATPSWLTEVAEVVTGDFGDRASLDRALEGIDRAFLLTARAPRQGEWEVAFIDAAVAAGVSWLVKHSAVGADPDAVGVASPHGVSERHLAEIGLPHVIVRPVMFMDNLLHWLPPIFSSGALVAPLVDPAVRVSLVDIADIAAVEALALVDERHLGRTYTLSGPELLTFGDIAKRMSAGAGTSLALEVVSVEEFRARCRASGAAQTAIDGQVEFFATLTSGTTALTVLTGDVEDVLGRPPTSLETFAARHADELLPRPEKTTA